MRDSTYILIGLHNPGEEYQLTRHNVGALSLEYCIEQWQNDMRYEHTGRRKSKLYESREYRYCVRDDVCIDIFSVFPNTYMNLSGGAVKSFLTTHGNEADIRNSVWIIHDDIDLPFGSFKIDRNISSGGHKGVQNVIEQLGTKDFIRFRIGILPPQGKKTPTDEFVLKKFNKTELEILRDSVFPAIHDALEMAFAYGIERAQNTFHKRKEKEITKKEKLPKYSLPV